MANKFSNCEVVVNNQRIMAQNASISQSNSLSPLKVIGYKNPLNTHAPNGTVKNSIKIDYIPETDNEPNHTISQMLTQYQYLYPIEIKVAGYVTTGYLDSYSLTVTENEPIKASAEYSIFHEITNPISEQSSTGYLGYNRLGGNGIAHYWTSRVMNSAQTTNGEIISLNYSFKANWQPVYKIGSPIPSQVTFLGAQQNFNLTSEYESNVTYSGDYIQDSLSNCAILQLNNLSYLWTETNWFPLTLSLEDGKVTSQTTNLSENNIITTQMEVVKYH
jgi:hypothetical protein